MAPWRSTISVRSEMCPSIWLGNPFEPCCDIDSLAVNVRALADHIAKIDADAEHNGAICGDVCIRLRHPFLKLDRCLDGIDRARKLDKHAVAHHFHDSTAVIL